MLTHVNNGRHSGPNPRHTQTEIEWSSWLKLHAGVDFPREIDWMEIRRLFGGAIMAVGLD